MDQASEGDAESEMLTAVGLAVSNEPDAKETSGEFGELLFFFSLSEPCCRFCGRASVYLDCG
jgi:hypothetical protein